jgi:hypothetical protein
MKKVKEHVLGTFQLTTIGISDTGEKCKLLKFRAVSRSNLMQELKFHPFDDHLNFTVCIEDQEVVNDIDPGEFFEVVIRRTKVE